MMRHTRKTFPIPASLLVVAMLIVGCRGRDAIVFPRIGMPLMELQTLIGRTKPDTLPTGKPPYYMHVKVFGQFGNLGVEVDSNGKIFFIGFQPEDRGESIRAKMVQICKDTLGKPTSESHGLQYDPAYANYLWYVNEHDYILTMGQKYVSFFAGTPKETPRLPSPPKN